jgi:hypothetical protein
MNIRSIEKFILYGYKANRGSVLKKYIKSAVLWCCGSIVTLLFGFICLTSKEGTMYAFTREDIDDITLCRYVGIVLLLMPITVILMMVYNKWWLGKLHKYSEQELQQQSARAAAIAATGGPCALILARLVPAWQMNSNDAMFFGCTVVGLISFALVTLRCYQIYLLLKYRTYFRDYRLRIPKIR